MLFIWICYKTVIVVLKPVSYTHLKLPDAVIERSKVILQSLENNNIETVISEKVEMPSTCLLYTSQQAKKLL